MNNPVPKIGDTIRITYIAYSNDYDDMDQPLVGQTGEVLDVSLTHVYEDNGMKIVPHVQTKFKDCTLFILDDVDKWEIVENINNDFEL